MNTVPLPVSNPSVTEQQSSIHDFNLHHYSGFCSSSKNADLNLHSLQQPTSNKLFRRRFSALSQTSTDDREVEPAISMRGVSPDSAIDACPPRIDSRLGTRRRTRIRTNPWFHPDCSSSRPTILSSSDWSLSSSVSSPRSLTTSDVSSFSFIGSEKADPYNQWLPKCYNYFDSVPDTSRKNRFTSNKYFPRRHSSIDLDSGDVDSVFYEAEVSAGERKRSFIPVIVPQQPPFQNLHCSRICSRSLEDLDHKYKVPQNINSSTPRKLPKSEHTYPISYSDNFDLISRLGFDSSDHVDGKSSPNCREAARSIDEIRGSVCDCLTNLWHDGLATEADTEQLRIDELVAGEELTRYNRSVERALVSGKHEDEVTCRREAIADWLSQLRAELDQQMERLQLVYDQLLTAQLKQIRNRRRSSMTVYTVTESDKQKLSEC